MNCEFLEQKTEAQNHPYVFFKKIEKVKANEVAHFRVLLCLCSKMSLSAKPLHENEFCMKVHFHANQSHFHKNGFTLRLALKQRRKGTRKWAINDTTIRDYKASSLTFVSRPLWSSLALVSRSPSWKASLKPWE